MQADLTLKPLVSFYQDLITLVNGKDIKSFSTDFLVCALHIPAVKYTSTLTCLPLQEA